MTSAVRLPYRLQQVLAYTGTSKSGQPVIPEDALARLSEPMLHQFRILDPSDQSHLLKVYLLLKTQQADEDTVTAGLIHDVGKACAKCRITILDRGLHVILSRIATPMYKRFAAIDVAPAALRGLHRLANHAERGALAASQAGYNDRVVFLVRHHESGGDKHDEQLNLLREADAMAERI